MNSRLPLLDLHRHLDGNVRLSTILELGQQFDITLPHYSIDGLRPYAQVTTIAPDLVGFLDRNYIQIDGDTREVMPLDPLDKKFESFGWHVIDIDAAGSSIGFSCCGY